MVTPLHYLFTRRGACALLSLCLAACGSAAAIWLKTGFAARTTATSSDSFAVDGARFD